MIKNQNIISDLDEYHINNAYLKERIAEKDLHIAR